jgi:hypothetical protein
MTQQDRAKAAGSTLDKVEKFLNEHLRQDDTARDEYPKDFNFIREALTIVVGTHPDLVVVPRKLTAENGYKYLMIGEFFEYIEQTDDEGSDTAVKVQVGWDTIKRIHDKIVAAQEGDDE